MQNKNEFIKHKERFLEKINKDKQLTLFTHKDCSDGTGAAVVTLKYCEANDILVDINFIQYSSNDEDAYKEVTEEQKTGNILITDFSFNKSQTEDLFSKASSLILLDHHKTAFDNGLGSLPYCKLAPIIDNASSAAGVAMTWDFFYDAQERPLFVKLINDHDIYKFEFGNKTKAFHIFTKEKGKELLPEHPFIADDAYIENIVDTYMHDTIKTQNKVSKEAKRLLKQNQVLTLDNKKFITGNVIDEISAVGNTICKMSDEYSSCTYFITDKKIIFSLRSIDDAVDCSKIAKIHNGGGHHFAAGMSFPLEEFDFHTFFTKLRIETNK